MSSPAGAQMNHHLWQSSLLCSSTTRLVLASHSKRTFPTLSSSLGLCFLLWKKGDNNARWAGMLWESPECQGTAQHAGHHPFLLLFVERCTFNSYQAFLLWNSREKFDWENFLNRHTFLYFLPLLIPYIKVVNYVFFLILGIENVNWGLSICQSVKWGEEQLPPHKVTVRISHQGQRAVWF